MSRTDGVVMRHLGCEIYSSIRLEIRSVSARCHNTSAAKVHNQSWTHPFSDVSVLVFEDQTQRKIVPCIPVPDALALSFNGGSRQLQAMHAVLR